MDSQCLWVGAGYPVLLGAIGVLFKLLLKAQERLLKKEESHKATLEELKKILEQKGGTA